MRDIKMETKKRSVGKYLNTTVILYAVIWIIQIFPNKTKEDVWKLPAYMLVFLTVLLIIQAIITVFAYEKPVYETGKTIIGTIYVVLTVWLIFTSKTNILDESLFPSPEMVFRQLISDRRLPGDVLSSMITLAKGYLTALILGIFLGSAAGMSKKLSGSLTYITTFLKLIPPIVYIPYAIALLPHYGSVSVFVIFMSSFWPIFSSTFAGVSGVEKQYLDSAKVLNVGYFSKIINVILPASLSEIFIGCNQGLAYSFILLTSAEMIGGSSGIGYYIKYYSNFGDFKRIIVGILVIGATISVITFFMNKLEAYLLRWRPR